MALELLEDRPDVPVHSILSQYLAEFIGTYFLVLTIGFNVLTGSVAAAVSIGSMLMVMIYALGTVSGAHFNPAVTVAVWLSSRDLMTLGNTIVYIIVQLLGAGLAGVTYSAVTGSAFVLAPVGPHSAMSAAIVETIYTAALCYVVLNVATTRQQEGNNYFGLAIGFTVVSAALAIGGISGCCLNPAVCVGVTLSGLAWHGTHAASYLALYTLAPIGGAAIACICFYTVQKKDEYSDPY